MQHIHMLVGSTVPEPLGQYWIIVCGPGRGYSNTNNTEIVAIALSVDDKILATEFKNLCSIVILPVQWQPAGSWYFSDLCTHSPYTLYIYKICGYTHRGCEH